MRRESNIGIIKANIKEQLRERNIKVNVFCKRMGRSRYYIAQLPHTTSVNIIVDIAYAIGCDPSELLKGL